MSRAGQPTGREEAGELGAPLLGQRLRTRASRPPVDPRLVRFDPSVRRMLVVVVLLAALTAAALVAQASAVAAVVARTFLEGADLAAHRSWLLLLLVAVAVRAGATWAMDVVARRTAARVKSRLRAAVVARLTRRSPSEDQLGTTGELASALTDGIDGLDGTFAGYLPALASGVVVPTVIVAWLVSTDPTSAVVLAVTLPLIPLFMVLIGLAARAATRTRFRALTALSGHFLQVLEGVTTIRVARATGRVGRAVRDAGERLRRTTLETLRVAFLSALVLELFAALAVATVAVIAGVRLATGTGAAFEPVLVALLLAPEAFLPLRRIGQQFHANEDGAAAAERLFDLLEAPAAPVLTGRRPAPDPAQVPIRFERVTVQYPGRPLPALDRVDLRLGSGQLVAVVGASGAGKSTLGAVLLGLLPPSAGRVVAGTVDVADLDQDAWYARLAWVPQTPAPLAGTIRELVSLGCDREPSDGDVWEALAAVSLDAEVAALPAGLDTQVGPGGRGLSSGQLRRVALARALLRPAGMVVLDEPTGDLDVDSEMAFRHALGRLRGQRTVVVLTHRVALAADADVVVVLDGGRVVETGAPHELLGRPGAFAALVDASRPLESAEVAVARPAPSLRVPEPERDVDSEEVEEDRRPPDTSASGLLAPHRRPLALAVAAGALAPLAGVLLVSLSTYLLARAALRPNILDLTVAIVGVRALALLKGTSRYVERLAGHDVALRTMVDLRVHAYRRLVDQAPAGLGRFRAGDVLGRVVGDVERLSLALIRGVVPLFGGLVASAAVVVVAGVLLPGAGVVAGAGLALSAVGVPLLARRLARRPEQELARGRGRLGAQLVDLLRAAPELRLLGRLDHARHALEIVDTEVARLDRSSLARGGGADALTQLVLGITAVGLILVGVPAVTGGRLDGVLLGALVVLAWAAIEAVGPLPASMRALVAARAAARRLSEVLDAPPPTADGAGAEGAGTELVVERATARYPGAGTPAVHDLDVVVAPGRRVAVVGRSGAGKSTLAALAVRFLDPEAGQVRLGRVALTQLAGDDVRRHVGLAPQMVHVFDGTIEDNLRLAAPGADDDDLWEALAAAHLDEWVRRLPDGLATEIGERGCRVSAGQRHRLALARTLLGRTPLLILDEPTADLDPATGRAFLADTLRAAGRRGVLLLTHDLRALPVADEVIVLEDGHVVARGRHDDLLATNTAYATRWRLEQRTPAGSAGPYR